MIFSKNSLDIPDELVEFIKTGSKFIIIGHKEPDGDCIGSQLVLRGVLQRMGKEVILCSEGPFKRTEINIYSECFLSELSEKETTGAKVIIVDCSTMERIGNFKDAIKGLPFAIIDHHAAVNLPSNTPLSPVFVDSSSPSCTLIIEKLITALGQTPTKEEAVHLLFGVCTDTGFFRHLTENNAQVFEAVARMVRQGASPKNAYNEINSGKCLNSRILLGRILSRTESHYNGKLLISDETLEESNSFGYENRDSDGLMKLLLTTDGVEVVAIIRQECEEYCTVSLRSVDKVDVSDIAASFGGGGHKNASGFKIYNNIPIVKKVLLESLKNILENK